MVGFLRSGFAGVVLTVFPAFGFVGGVLVLGVVLVFFDAAGVAGASGSAGSFGALSRSSIRLSVTSTASRSSLAASFGLGGALIGEKATISAGGSGGGGGVNPAAVPANTLPSPALGGGGGGGVMCVDPPAMSRMF